MAKSSHKTEGVNRTQTRRFYPFVFTGEEHDEETSYGYCDDYQPHAVKRMFDYKNGMLYDMRWDEEKSSGLFDSVAENKSAGNLGQVSIAKPGEMFEAGRFLFWTEDCCGPRPCGANRMHAAVDDKHYSYYAYDHSGGSCASREQSQACLSYAEMEQRRRSQRRLKLTGDNKLLDVNADFMATYTLMSEPTLYPSAYMVLTNKGYTNVAKAESRASSLALPRRSSVTVRKHYYAGTERVAARLGGGGLDAIGHAIGSNDTLLEKADLLYKQSLDQVNNRVLHENDLDCIMHNEFSKEEFGYWIDDIPHQMKAEVEIDHGQFKDMVNSMLDDINRGQEKEVYFYHSDHLGSASWITDFSGVAVQHIQYLPYGEPYIDQRAAGTTYSERFRFTGKEKDEETGYGYFGARYMDHELMTMWLSVDPMADKYPSISPYAYCAWNPVNLVDPDGREIDVSQLPSEYQKRLMSCLSAITGLALSVKEGKIRYDENTTDYNKGSMSARIDLMAAIDDENHTVMVKFGGENKSKQETGLEAGVAYDSYVLLSSRYLRKEFDNSSRYGQSNDASTFGLGLAFMHELLHAYYGYVDPSSAENDNTFSKKAVGPPTIKIPIEKTDSFKKGISVVGRVNIYRKELGLDKRATYASYPGYGVPFEKANGQIYWIGK